MVEQLTLLTAPGVRASDPSTSQQAADTVAKGSAALEDLIGACIGRNESLTAEQIADRILGVTARWSAPSIVTAVTRARRRGLIVPHGVGITSRGRNSITYKPGEPTP